MTAAGVVLVAIWDADAGKYYFDFSAFGNNETTFRETYTFTISDADHLSYSETQDVVITSASEFGTDQKIKSYPDDQNLPDTDLGGSGISTSQFVLLKGDADLVGTDISPAGPDNSDYTETVKTLAGLSRFISLQGLGVGWPYAQRLAIRVQALSYCGSFSP